MFCLTRSTDVTAKTRSWFNKESSITHWFPFSVVRTQPCNTVGAVLYSERWNLLALLSSYQDSTYDYVSAKVDLDEFVRSSASWRPEDAVLVPSGAGGANVDFSLDFGGVLWERAAAACEGLIRNVLNVGQETIHAWNCCQEISSPQRKRRRKKSELFEIESFQLILQSSFFLKTLYELKHC